MLPPAQDGLAFIAAREAFVATVYADAHAPASGFGLNDPALTPGQTTTMEAAIEKFVAFNVSLTAQIDKLIGSEITPRLAQHECDAIRSLAYNVGAGGPYQERPGGGLRFQKHLLDAIEAYLDADRADAERTAFLRDIVGQEITLVNSDPTTGRPFNAGRRWREAILFVQADYGDLSTLESWPEGKDPRRDKPDLIPMPKFIS
jgi:hypothetical protein